MNRKLGWQERALAKFGLDMFQSALIRPHGSNFTTVNAGVLAETLIFYDKIQVVADRGLFGELLAVIPPADFLNLIKSNMISFSYSKSTPVIFTRTKDQYEEHLFTSFSVSKGPDGKRITKKDEVRTAITSIMGFNRSSRKIIDDLLERTVFIDSSSPGNDSLQIAHEELDDDTFLLTAVKELMQLLVPSYKLPTKWGFRPLYIDGSFTIVTDLDFNSINEEFHKYVPATVASITPAFLLSFILFARNDAKMAADYMSEIVTKDEVSALIRLKVLAAIRKRDRSVRQIDIFQETVLNDCRKIREAINSGDRTFSDFLKVLEKAKKFKNWVADQNPDANLLTEYYQAVVADGPMESLPAKTIRYVSATIAGIVNPIAGLVIAGTDEFFVDKMFKGWRPNHFVDGPLKKFASSD